MTTTVPNVDADDPKRRPLTALDDKRSYRFVNRRERRDAAFQEPRAFTQIEAMLI